MGRKRRAKLSLSHLNLRRPPQKPMAPERQKGRVPMGWWACPAFRAQQHVVQLKILAINHKLTAIEARNKPKT